MCETCKLTKVLVGSIYVCANKQKLMPCHAMSPHVAHQSLLRLDHLNVLFHIRHESLSPRRDQEDEGRTGLSRESRRDQEEGGGVGLSRESRRDQEQGGGAGLSRESRRDQGQEVELDSQEVILPATFSNLVVPTVNCIASIDVATVL